MKDSASSLIRTEDRYIIIKYYHILLLRNGTLDWGTLITSRKVSDWISDEVIGFSSWPNSSSRTMALGSTQPLAEMSTRNLPVRKGLSARKVDNLISICEPIA
jgi:hypothetical protein